MLLSSFAKTALFSLVWFVSSLFRLFVYKPMWLTMPVCVLSCAYCCHRVSVAPLASTRCKVNTMTKNRVLCLCEGSTLWLFLLPLTPPSRPPPLTFDRCSEKLVRLSCQDKAECAPGLLTGICENLLLSFLIILRRVIQHCRLDKYQYNQSSNVI